MASSKYQFMELNLQKRMTGLKEKIPDIQKTVDSVRFLKIKKASFLNCLCSCDRRVLTVFQDDPEPVETTFELNDTLYAKANIPPTEEVYIWLGVRSLPMLVKERLSDSVTGQRHAVL
jgi:prefoldin subunit